VVEFNGSGNNGSEVRDGIAYEIKAGEVGVYRAVTLSSSVSSSCG
jgi:hypothetical protein